MLSLQHLFESLPPEEELKKPMSNIKKIVAIKVTKKPPVSVDPELASKQVIADKSECTKS